MLKKYLQKLMLGEDLTRFEINEVMEKLVSQDVSSIQAGGLLTAMQIKGPSSEELTGAAEMLRRHCNFIDCGGMNVVDIVGTGGDGGISFNISTTSAFVAAGAGVTIAKHGNRAVSGKCGAADVLEELGFNLNVSADVMESCIKTHGIGFLFAPRMHPVLGSVTKIRKELGVRTIFNMLGPLTNPAGAASIVLGVYDPSLTELFADALKKLNVRRAMVVHGLDGLDEISCTEETRVSELKNGQITTYELFPEMLLGNSWDRNEISGGDAKTNADILCQVLDGSAQGAQRGVVLLNAGAVIYTAGLCESLQEGIELAARSIDTGRAMEKLKILIDESQNS